LLLMKQVASIISIYAADISGVASAMFELGGMTVMHDASGCNSTYNTHDEPRWYDMDSMVFISGLSEMEAVMGDDNKLIHDIEEAAKELSPAFITIAGTPIPMMMGTDFPAIASIIEHDMGIPCFGLPTNSMRYYSKGAGMAFEALAKRMVDPPSGADHDSPSINILGMTPLDFSVVGTDTSLRNFAEENGFRAISTWAMGSALDEIRRAADADVNLVVSESGLPAARELKRRFGTPYVIGLPCGETMKNQILIDLKEAAETKENRNSYRELRKKSIVKDEEPSITLIGESVIMSSAAASLEAETGRRARLLCPLEPEDGLLSDGDIAAEDETDLIPYLKAGMTIIADPLYKPICPKGANFAALPHEGFSGRIFRDDIPDLVGGWDEWVTKTQIK